MIGCDGIGFYIVLMFMMCSVDVPVMRVRLMAMLHSPRRYGDPQPKADQRKAGYRIDSRSVAFGNGCACYPDYDCNGERRKDMTNASLKRGDRGFCLRPAALPRNHGNWKPVIRHHREQHSYRKDCTDQQQLRTEIHLRLRLLQQDKPGAVEAALVAQ